MKRKVRKSKSRSTFVIIAVVFFVLGFIAGSAIIAGYARNYLESPAMAPPFVGGPPPGVRIVDGSSPAHGPGYAVCRIFWGVSIVGLMNPGAADFFCGANENLN